MPSRHEKKYRLGPRQGVDATTDVVAADMGSTVAVVLTHPWGCLGGNMHNNVVVAAALFFQQELGMSTARFDFCGTQVGRGYRQVDQVRQVAGALLRGECCSGGGATATSDEQGGGGGGGRRTRPPRYILLFGYSYGSLIASSASADLPQCVGVVSVAPPYAVQHWLLMFCHGYHMRQSALRADLPRLLVIGSRDNFTSESLFKSTIAEYYPPPAAAASKRPPSSAFDVDSRDKNEGSNNINKSGSNENDRGEIKTTATTGAVIKDADHFFGGRERDLMDVVAEWLLSAFSEQCRGDLRRLREAEFAVAPSTPAPGP